MFYVTYPARCCCVQVGCQVKHKQTWCVGLFLSWGDQRPVLCDRARSKHQVNSAPLCRLHYYLIRFIVKYYGLTSPRVPN